MSLVVEQGASLIEPEDRLIERLRLRDLDVFEAFYKAYRPRLRSFILGIISNEQTVDEVFDDVMMVVWDKINDFEERSKLSTWVFGIAYRRALKERGKLQEFELIDEAAEGDISAIEAEKPFEAIRAKTHIRTALDRLPSDQGTVVRLAYFEGLSYREIGAIMRCPEDTVKTRMFHARRKLKSALGGSLDDWI